MPFTHMACTQVVRGYGARHLPLGPGAHTIEVPMFVPVTSSVVDRLVGYVCCDSIALSRQQLRSIDNRRYFECEMRILDDAIAFDWHL